MSDDNTPPQEPPPPPPAYDAPSGPAPGYAAAPPPPGAPTGPVPAGLGERFLARVIDGILVALVQWILVSAIIVGAIMGSSGNYYTSGSDYAGSLVSGILGAVLYVGYFGFMESTRGQTLGKMALKLRTHGPAGGNPTLEQAIRRNIWAGATVLAIIPVVGGVLGGLIELVAVIVIAMTINGDPVARQGWHDKFAGGTRVVKEG